MINLYNNKLKYKHLDLNIHNHMKLLVIVNIINKTILSKYNKIIYL